MQLLSSAGACRLVLSTPPCTTAAPKPSNTERRPWKGNMRGLRLASGAAPGMGELNSSNPEQPTASQPCPCAEPGMEAGPLHTQPTTTHSASTQSHHLKAEQHEATAVQRGEVPEQEAGLEPTEAEVGEGDDLEPWKDDPYWVPDFHCPGWVRRSMHLGGS